MRNITNGIYQYGVDVVVEDGSIEYLSELIDDLSWHQASRDWRYKKEFQSHNLQIPIDLFE